jgi:trehalose synthase
MIPRLSDYSSIVGKDVIERIRKEAEPLEGKHITHINSTSSGGGVSEILNTMVILQNELGILVGWRLLKGTHTFFTITKKFHNALQGENMKLSDSAKSIYLEEIERNAIMNHLHKHDLVVVHDPQPLAMVKHYPKRQPWLWRCHIDITHRSQPIWNFLRDFVRRYDGMIVSMKKYRQGGIRIPQFVVPVSIDPLNLKNMQLSQKSCIHLLSQNGIDLHKPILCQVSRFDKWKNPLGVVRMFEMVRQKVDCQLVLIGDMATDDPEGPIIYNRLMERVSGQGDIHVIAKRADLLVNALQRMSHAIIQNSRREGFGLTVTEALYKGTPVVAMNRGGIPLQVRKNRTGFLISNSREGAKRCIQLIEDERLRKRLGRAGKEHVKRNFLITRHMLDYIRIFNHYINGPAS